MNSRLLSTAGVLWIACMSAWGGPVIPSAHADEGLEGVRGRIAAGGAVKIVCFGDSITGVYYHTGSRRSWCDLVGTFLERHYPQARVEMINAGVSGNTSAAGLKRIDRDVLQHRPDLVIVMFGMNDVRSVQLPQFKENLREIVRRVRDQNAEILLMTPNAIPPGDPNRPPEKVMQYAQQMRQLAQTLAVPVVDAYAAFAAIREDDPVAARNLMSDTIHPNFRGHRLFAEAVTQCIVREDLDFAPPPTLRPGLPRVLARLRRMEPVRVVAMPPYDAMVEAGIRRWFPQATVDVTSWEPDPADLAATEQEAKRRGWTEIRSAPKETAPDLVILAIPASSGGVTEDDFYRSYSWIINWSLPFGGQADEPQWDCVVLLKVPTTPAEKNAESRARDVIRGQDVPWLERESDDTRKTDVIFSEWLGDQLTSLESRVRE
ncbi:MAG TPA: GDSL-type esterase/lipase family protein [Opitutaceae bacterium]|nr:GDSL-type esterase/lipase family protein [Opitutaceae bacterium]